MIKKLMLLTVLAFGLTQIACNKVDLVADFMSQLNEEEGSGDSHRYSLTKRNTERGQGWVLVRDNATDLVYAVNLTHWEAGMTLAEFLITSADAGLTPDLITQSGLVYVGNGNWQDTSGNLYEETGASSKDLEKIAAFAEEKKINTLGEALSAEYGLSEDRGIEIARLNSQWKKLSENRSMTNADAQAFTKEVMGVSLDKAVKAFNASRNGSSRNWNNILENAAELNGTSPEQMRDIIKSFVK